MPGARLDLAGFDGHMTRAGVAPRTRRAYVADLRLLAGGSDTIMQARADESLTRRTHGAARARSALRTYVEWARPRGLIDADFVPPAGKRLGPPRRAQRFLSETDRSQFIEAAQMVDPPIRGFLTLLYACGLRIGEAVAMDRASIEALAQRGEVIVRGKGDHDRPILLEEIDGIATRQDVDNVRGLLAIDGWGRIADLLIGSRGEWSVARCDLATKRGRRIVAGVGIGIKARPHDLRRTFGDRVQSLTGDIRATQIALGHASIETTVRYTQGTPAALRRALHGRRSGGGQ